MARAMGLVVEGVLELCWWAVCWGQVFPCDLEVLDCFGERQAGFWRGRLNLRIRSLANLGCVVWVGGLEVGGLARLLNRILASSRLLELLLSFLNIESRLVFFVSFLTLQLALYVPHLVAVPGRESRQYLRTRV